MTLRNPPAGTECKECGHPAGHNLGCRVGHQADVAEIERLRAALRMIAMQMKSDELGEDDGDDFEGAYDSMIEEAREALAHEQTQETK